MKMDFSYKKIDFSWIKMETVMMDDFSGWDDGIW